MVIGCTKSEMFKFPSMNFYRLGAALLMVLIPHASLYARSLTASERQVVEDAATLAQTQCYREIYRDTYAYGQCLRELLKTEPSNAFRSMGIAYFGFAGALSYVRVSQLGADQMAAEFLKSYRGFQKKLTISDASLCATLPGNCENRIAQALKLEASPVKLSTLRMRCKAQVCRMEPE